ncbi:glycosyltransferase family 2 protein [Polynucleobacter sp. MWH-Braz-FAM2G]|uniref:glycosyltransferase family 2 protein n=1 Tax=Polynucleobacter sp. MWH-Braz-FAM2G TaxID=1855883 RepID=UPI001BFEB453|nr:glycosyltransferase family 2 protein [Polynucleobacter sp. MWH-Braz-FAM2G]QWD91078.1 glycosyltransferase family 2 protein [Polynucleobacter sp. MWH-Braz-FAM2G]
MSTKQIPVSVVIPCYKSKGTIERALNSILDQTVSPAEIILVDDASHDGTYEKLLSLQKQFPLANIIVDVLDKNGGPGEARNRAWSLASQPWLAFLDADDAWCADKLKTQWDWIEHHPDAVVVGHLTKEVSQDDFNKVCFGHSADLTDAKSITFLDMLIANRFFTRTVMLRADVPYRFQCRKFTEDYLLWLEIVLSGASAYVLNRVMAVSFRPEFSAGGYSGQLWKHEKRELRSWIFLYQQKKISVWILIAALPWSYLKYLRRAWRRSI